MINSTKESDSRKNENELTKLENLNAISELQLKQNLIVLRRINELNEQIKQTKNRQFSKMFRKLNRLGKATDKKKGDDKTKKERNEKPLIKVIHDTVTKNSERLFVNNVDDLKSTNLITNSCSKSPNQSLNSSTSNHFNQLKNNHNVLDNLTNRKIEDVRSRSESKLTNCQRKPTKLKSESFYFLESQSKTPLNHSKDDHLDKDLKTSKNKLTKREQEVFLNKKLIAESLVKSNRNSEMNSLLNQSSDSTKSSNRTTSPNQLTESNNTSHKVPSYIGISCFQYGYSGYTRNNKYGNANNLSQQSSPSSNIIRRLNDPTLANKSFNDKPNGQFLDVNRKIESYNSFKHNLNNSNHLDSQNRNHLHQNHHLPNLNISNHSDHLTSLNNFDSFDNSLLSKDRYLLNDASLSKDEDDKSLVQKRIESLYGHAYATNWKSNRSKLRAEKTNNDSFRSPSCPPEFISSQIMPSKKNLPVFKYIQNSIFNGNSGSNIKDEKTKINDTQAKSEETISCNVDKSKDEESSNELNSLMNLDDDHNLNEIDADNKENLIGDNLLIQDDANDKLNNLDSIKEDLLNDNKVGLLIENGTDEVDNIKLNEMLNLNNNNQAANDGSNDGRWYLKKLDEEIDKINVKISLVEAICLDENLNNREEIDGKIRASIGKANLLINQKLSQFKELCNKNINQAHDEQYKTLNQDLEGFFEMVSFQIDDIHKTFDEILFLQNNNWIIQNDLLSTPTRKATSKNSSKANSRCNSKPNSKPSSRNTSKEDLRRLKLKEVKRKQQNNLQNNNKDDDIVIFLPNNKSETKVDNL